MTPEQAAAWYDELDRLMASAWRQSFRTAMDRRDREDRELYLRYYKAPDRGTR